MTVADLHIWHGSGTNLSRRRPPTTVGAPPDQARVCLAAPPPASATLSACDVDQRQRRRLAAMSHLARCTSEALSLGSCGSLQRVRVLTCANGGAWPCFYSAAFTVIPRSFWNALGGAGLRGAGFGRRYRLRTAAGSEAGKDRTELLTDGDEASLTAFTSAAALRSLSGNFSVRNFGLGSHLL